jgi:hypothetical protein
LSLPTVEREGIEAERRTSEVRARGVELGRDDDSLLLRERLQDDEHLSGLRLGTGDADDDSLGLLLLLGSSREERADPVEVLGERERGVTETVGRRLGGGTEEGDLRCRKCQSRVRSGYPSLQLDERAREKRNLGRKRTWCLLASSSKPFSVHVRVAIAPVASQSQSAFKSSPDDAQGEAELKTGTAPRSGAEGKRVIESSECV